MRAVDCPPFTLDVHRHVSMYVSEVHHSKPLATELHKLLLQLAFVSPSIVWADVAVATWQHDDVEQKRWILLIGFNAT